MSASPHIPPEPTATLRRARHGLITLLSIALVLLGLVLGGLGAWLASLGGSWYYVLAGLGLLVSGVLLWGNRRAGALWFGLVFVGTLLWTWWESGSDYWRWVPRLGLIVGIGFVLSLLLPTLDRPVSPMTLSADTASSRRISSLASMGLSLRSERTLLKPP